MGQEISRSIYTEDEEREFKSRLTQETSLLKEEFESQTINETKLMCGYEVEGWLVNNRAKPVSSAPTLIQRIKDESIVPEISKFNFEINGAPQFFNGQTLSRIQSDIEFKWNRCQTVANMSGWDITTIGSLPTVQESDLVIENMSPHKRYLALNNKVIEKRGGNSIHLQIQGKEKYSSSFPDVMTESAATSMQIHIGTTQETAKAKYNASVIASSIFAGTCANSPYLFGKELWDESRVAVFEQSVDVDGFTNRFGENIKRVSLGNGYVQNCISEIFQENLDKFDILIPEINNEPLGEYKHISFHNGTIWRWVRPIISKCKSGKTHLRLEQRVPSAGPSNIDMVANMAFIIGLTEYLAKINDLEFLIPFYTAKYNFYNACKTGLNTNIIWFNGQHIPLKVLVLDHLISPVTDTLFKMGMDKDEVNYYIVEVFAKRIKMDLNGSNWQKKFVQKYGKNFEALASNYIHNQKSGMPLWRWKI